MNKNKVTNTPHVSRTEALLKSSDLIRNPVKVFEEYRKKLGPNYSFFFGGVKRTIVTSDPDFIQYILKTNSNNYCKSDIQVDRMAEFQGVGLLNSHGDYWKKQRRLLSMGFTRSKLSELLPLQISVLNDYMSSFDKSVENGPVDIYDQMVRFTLRSVGKSLFGDSLKDAELQKLGDTISSIQSFIVKQIFRPYLIPWYRISGQTEHYQKMRREADQIVVDYVNKRRLSGSEHWDFLQLILETPYKDTGELMSDEQVMIEILQLLVAGNETSSNGLTWAFYLLAKHPDCLKKVREEVNTIFGDREIDYHGLHNLNYTVSVLNETLRLYPPFWMIDRVAQNDDEFMGIQIPAGSVVVPYIYGAHHNTEYWENPYTFDPDRFSNEKSKKIHSFAHIPFGGGPRVCIGQNMALMQILLVLASVVRKYNFKLHEDKDVEIDPMMILRPKGKVLLEFEPV